jgi:hypothetical protein
MSDMLDAGDVIARLCKLQERVRSRWGHGEPADCFCREGGFWKSKDYGPTYEQGYRNSGETLEFIERACSPEAQAVLDAALAWEDMMGKTGVGAGEIVTRDAALIDAVRAYRAAHAGAL